MFSFGPLYPMAGSMRATAAAMSLRLKAPHVCRSMAIACSSCAFQPGLSRLTVDIPSIFDTTQTPIEFDTPLEIPVN